MSQHQQPLVSVVLLSYNRPDYLRQALASLLDQSYEPLEITVVDNPSPASESVAHMLDQFPQVRLLRNSVNLGYAGGMNRGIARATGRYVYLTEDDIILDRDCIARLVAYMETHDDADLIAPVIYNLSAGTIRCAGGTFVLGGVYRRKIYGGGETDEGQFPQPFEVGYVDGAAMFARKCFWQRFVGFREEYFMYVEAVELCARVIKSGKRMAVVPQARVYHFEPPEQLAPPEMEFHKIKNFFSLYLLHAPARHLPEFLCRYAVINTARTLTGRNGHAPAPFLKALWWVARKTPSLIRERYTQARELS